MSIIDSYHRGDLYFQLLTKTSQVCAQSPTVTINAPAGMVIVGGGAYVDWESPPCSPTCPPGNWLTGMYPNSTGTTWTVVSKDGPFLNKAQIIAYCIVVRMSPTSPNYKVVSATGMTPTKQVDVPAGFTVVGGGARALGVINKLVGSYPTGSTGWTVTANQGPIMAWVIGLKTTLLTANGVIIATKTSISSIATRPKTTLVVPNFYLTGVGAKMTAVAPGTLLNLLLASFPQDRQTVVAEGKDHSIPNLTSNVTAYALGFF